MASAGPSPHAMPLGPRRAFADVANGGFERAALLAMALMLAGPMLSPFHRLPQPAFDMEWIAALCLALAALALGLARARKAEIALALPLWLCALVGVVAIQHARGQLNYASQFALAAVYASAIAAAYLVGRVVLAGGLRMRAVTWMSGALLAGALASVAIQWLQLGDVSGLPGWMYFEITEPWLRTRPFGNTGQANQLATYLTWAAIGALFLHARGARAVPIALALLALAMGLALTRSRMGFLAGLIPLALCWAPTALRPRSTQARTAFSLALAVGYVVGTLAVQGMVVYQGAAVDSAVARFGEAGGFSLRLGMWADALRVAASAPWLGTGFDQYAYALYELPGLTGTHTSTQNAHNLVLHLAAEVGWPLALTLAALGAWWALAGLEVRLAAADTSAVWALVAVAGLHACLEYPLSLMHFALPVALLFALAEPDVRSTLARSRVSSRLLVAAAAGGLVLGTTMKLEYDEISEVHYWVDAERRSQAGVSDETERRILALANAALLRNYAEALIVSLRLPDKVDPTPEEIDRHRRALTRTIDPRVIARLVVLEARAGDLDRAAAHARRLAMFSAERYETMRKFALEGVRSLGPNADPLRALLSPAAAAPPVAVQDAAGAR